MNWNEKKKEKKEKKKETWKKSKVYPRQPKLFPKTRNRDSPNFQFGCFLDYQTELNV